MKKREQDTALNLVHQLVQYDFSDHPLTDQLGQVDQGYGVTIQALQALAQTSKDPRIQSLAELAAQAWSHT